MANDDHRNDDFSDLPSLTSLRSQFDPSAVLTLALSFLIGVLIAVAGVSAVIESNEEETASPDPVAEDFELARTAVEPGPAVEVAGVVCENPVALVDETSSAADVIVAWNSTVQSAGDDCIPAFQESLGSTWAMNEAGVSIFGNAGSVYELSSGSDNLASGLSISLISGDSGAGEPDALVSVIQTVWGVEALDWELSCLDTDRPWAVTIQSDGLTIDIARCAGL